MPSDETKVALTEAERAREADAVEAGLDALETRTTARVPGPSARSAHSAPRCSRWPSSSWRGRSSSGSTSRRPTSSRHRCGVGRVRRRSGATARFRRRSGSASRALSSGSRLDRHRDPDRSGGRRLPLRAGRDRSDPHGPADAAVGRLGAVRDHPVRPQADRALLRHLHGCDPVDRERPRRRHRPDAADLQPRSGMSSAHAGSRLIWNVALPAAFPGFLAGLKQGWAFAGARSWPPS